MKRPCEECISYAICVSQRYLRCELLYNYARAYTDTDIEFWGLIHKIVPKCREISKEGVVAISGSPRYQGSGGITG